MQVMTVSSGKSFRRCPREYEYRYEQGLVPHGRAETLRFGTLIHSALEAWWLAGLLPSQPESAERLERAMLAIQQAQDVEQFERTKAEVMILGYHTRWQDSPLRPLAVEQEFCCPLVNPVSGAASRTWELRGKIDLIATDGDRTWIVEHKTSTEDVSTGSNYWAKLRLDSQVSTYFVGAQSLGYNVAGCVYDVLGKPVRSRLLATPMEARKYTKGSSKACPLCAKKNSPPPPHAIPLSDGEMVYCADGRVITEEGGRLYAGQRAVDEAPEEYWQRLVDLISPEPERWFVRGEVVRLEEERVDAAADTWQIARMIRESQLSKRWPRNPDACSRYGRMCDYWPLCTRTGSLHDYSVKAPHEELSGVCAPAIDSQGGHIIPVFIGEPVITASNLWGVPWK